MWTLAESETFDLDNCEYLQMPEILGDGHGPWVLVCDLEHEFYFSICWHPN